VKNVLNSSEKWFDFNREQMINLTRSYLRRTSYEFLGVFFLEIRRFSTYIHRGCLDEKSNDISWKKTNDVSYLQISLKTSKNIKGTFEITSKAPDHAHVRPRDGNSIYV